MYQHQRVCINTGCFLVTGPTGRGISVVDFLCINEQKETLEAVVAFFKKKNPTWEHVLAFITDKDFTDLSALKSLFPRAVQLLCQFHAIEAVRRAVRKSDLNEEQREKVEKMFRGLVHAHHARTFDQLKDELVDFLTPKHAAMARYFERNWFHIYLMWSNVGRTKRFSAGNNTTNRVESHWKHYKDIKGKQTGMDHCIAALLQYQASSFRQLTTEIMVRFMSSRTMYSVPAFFGDVANELSDFVITRLVDEWNMYTSDNVKWSVKARGGVGGVPTHCRLRALHSPPEPVAM